MTDEQKELTPDAFIAAHEAEVNKRWYPRFHIAPRVAGAMTRMALPTLAASTISSISTTRTAQMGADALGTCDE